MKRAIILLCVAAFGAAVHATPAVPENRFIGEWEGSIEGYDFNIVFMYSNTCIITVKAVRNGEEITEDTNGTWSCDENVVRINGSFPNSKIPNLNRISWTSAYVFTNSSNSAFNILVIPPGAGTRIRISFARINKWVDE